MTHPYNPRTSVYRPSYSTVRPQTPAGNPLNNDNTYVNRILLYRHHHRPIAFANQPLQLRDDHVDLLISRTTRAYDVVIHYERDSNGGTRWSPEDIEDIHHVGRYLHGDVRDLKHWKAVVEKEGDLDACTMGKIGDDEERLVRYCRRVLSLIRGVERVPLRERMVRGGGMERDCEDRQQDRGETRYDRGDDHNHNKVSG